MQGLLSQIVSANDFDACTLWQVFSEAHIRNRLNEFDIVRPL